MTHTKDSMTRDARIKKYGLENTKDLRYILKQDLKDEELVVIQKKTSLVNTALHQWMTNILRLKIRKLTTPIQDLFVQATPEIKPLNWLVKGILQKNELSLVYGPSGQRKSFVVLDMAIHISNGIDWRGHKVKDKVTVLYLAGEGYQGINNRLVAASKKHNLPFDNIYISKASGNLLDKEEMEKLSAAIETFNQPVWLIVDTLHRNFGNGDENSAKDIAVLLQNIDKYIKPTGCTTTLVHHTGHDQSRERGSSSIMAALDTKIKVVTEKNITSIKSEKQKDGEAFEDINLEGVTVILGEDEDEDLITSLALVDTDKEIEEKSTKKRTVDEELADSIYKRLPLSGEEVSKAIADWGKYSEKVVRNKKSAVKKILEKQHDDFIFDKDADMWAIA
jgi:RecA-family ATPase